MLKLDFIKDGPDGAPLIRIWGNDFAACATLRTAIKGIAQGQTESVAFDCLPSIEPIGECSVVASLGSWNRGLMQGEDSGAFEWQLTAGGWEDVIGLLEPFCEVSEQSGFQWLCRRGEINVLVSRDGRW